MRIDGAYWWDLGIYSNTPLDAVLDDEPPVDTLCFLVQLFAPHGPLPRRIDEVMTRHKDITYASRADRSMSNYKEEHDLRRAVDALCRRLPTEQRNEFSCLTIEEHLREGCEKTWKHCRWLQQIILHGDSDLPVGVFVRDPELEASKPPPKRRFKTSSPATGPPPPPPADTLQEKLMRLQAKSSMVTGAASGIGREIAHAYAREGAKVGIADLDEAGAKAAADET